MPGRCLPISSYMYMYFLCALFGTCAACKYPWPCLSQMAVHSLGGPHPSQRPDPVFYPPTPPPHSSASSHTRCVCSGRPLQHQAALSRHGLVIWTHSRCVALHTCMWLTMTWQSVTLAKHSVMILTISPARRPFLASRTLTDAARARPGLWLFVFISWGAACISIIACLAGLHQGGRGCGSAHS